MTLSGSRASPDSSQNRYTEDPCEAQVLSGHNPVAPCVPSRPTEDRQDDDVVHVGDSEESDRL